MKGSAISTLKNANRACPLVSIITVVFNGEKTLRDTIDSIRGQTYRNIEYIIIDGGSTDGTINIINENKDVIALFISENDNGIYDAMNKGIKYATGEIVGIINSDDWYEENTIERVVQYFEKEDVDVVYGKILLVNENGQLENHTPCSLDTMWYQMAVPHPSVFVKRSIYDEFGMFDLQYQLSADYELMLRLYSKSVKFGYLDKILAYFRKGGVSETQIKKGRRETLSISRKYVEQCDCKEEVVLIQNNMEEWWDIEDLLEENPYVIANLLENYFRQSVSEIAIFGTGIWSKKCYVALEKTHIKTLCFLDNLVTESFCGKETINPSHLLEKNIFVLIAVKKDSDKIKAQLEDLNIRNCVSVGDLKRTMIERRESILRIGK